MVKTLVKSVREYKKYAFLTPVCMVIEVVCECLIPLIMAKMIKSGEETIGHIVAYGSILILLAALSLFGGGMAGKFAASASCGFAKTSDKISFMPCSIFPSRTSINFLRPRWSRG